jgi:hypothetical protein
LGLVWRRTDEQASERGHEHSQAKRLSHAFPPA